MSRVATLLRQPRARRRLVPEAMVAMARARWSVRRRGQYGALDSIGVRAAPMSSFNANDVRPLLRDIGWSIEASAKTLPFDTLCLTQAIAAARMLTTRGLPWEIHVGLARGDE